VVCALCKANAAEMSESDPDRSLTPLAVNLRNLWPAPRLMHEVVRGPERSPARAIGLANAAWGG
jgi:hypothetical protein